MSRAQARGVRALTPRLSSGNHDPRAVSVGVGAQHSCAVVADGRVWCWGRNDAAQLGDGSTSVAAHPTAVVVVGISNAVTVALGTLFSCAALVDGEVACWGDNAVGQLGDGSTVSRTTPARVPL